MCGLHFNPLSVKSKKKDIPEAVEAALTIKPKFVIPIHRLNSDPIKLKKQLEKTSKIKVLLPNPGETQKIE